MLATIDKRFHGHRIVVFGTSTDIQENFGIRSSTDVCVYLVRTPFGWKTKFVSGNCERST
jgi:hypothetical protein